MSHYRLSYLELEGFRSFSERQRVDFPEKGMILISGKYRGNLVSSGSGKSSVVEAIAFALDICSIPATELKCWYNKNIYVKLGITDGKNTIEIERTPKLNLIINGESWSELSGGAKEKLYSILGLSPEILAQVSYRQQREKGIFLNSTDGELKKFLTKTLNLELLELEADKFAKKASLLQISIETHKRDIDNLESLVETSKVDEEDIFKAQKELQLASESLSKISANDNSEIDAKIQQLNAENSFLNQKINEIQNEINKLITLAAKVDSVKKENASIKERIIELKSQLDKLKNNICHTCERHWEDDKVNFNVKNKEQTIESLIFTLKGNIDYIKNSEIAISTINNLKLESNQIKEKQIEINNEKQKLSIEKGTLGAPLTMAIQVKNLAESALTSLMSKRQTYENITKKIQQTKQNLALDEAEYEINYYCAKSLGKNGFLAFIFEETLVGIQNRSNEIIKNVPNIESFSLDISTTKTTKTTKSVKEEIKKSILKNGFEISFKSLSGGQQAAMELATDLATAKEIKQKAGSGIGWIMLDESMDGLGTTEKQAAIEIIKEKFDGQIIIIDHSTEVKEAFTQVIEVEYDGKTSRIN